MNCDPRRVEKAVQAIRSMTDYTVAKMKPSMGGEDFAYYTQKAPGVFFFVGGGNPEKGIISAHHSPSFNIDEQAISVMAEVLLAAYYSVVSEA